MEKMILHFTPTARGSQWGVFITKFVFDHGFESVFKGLLVVPNPTRDQVPRFGQSVTRKCFLRYLKESLDAFLYSHAQPPEHYSDQPVRD
jgi:hypothetical protein